MQIDRVELREQPRLDRDAIVEAEPGCSDKAIREGRDAQSGRTIGSVSGLIVFQTGCPTGMDLNFSP